MEEGGCNDKWDQNGARGVGDAIVRGDKGREGQRWEGGAERSLEEAASQASEQVCKPVAGQPVAGLGLEGSRGSLLNQSGRSSLENSCATPSVLCATMREEERERAINHSSS